MGNTMDFIVTWFGISPDGGNGSTELIYIMALVVVLWVLAFRWPSRQMRDQ
jgi:hypothetical protein